MCIEKNRFKKLYILVILLFVMIEPFPTLTLTSVMVRLFCSPAVVASSCETVCAITRLSGNVNCIGEEKYVICIQTFLFCFFLCHNVRYFIEFSTLVLHAFEKSVRRISLFAIIYITLARKHV